MSTGRPDSSVVRRLLKLAGVRDGPVSDRELVERFVKDRSEGAFADLMARHGPMVLAVCRRYLRDPHAADDAYQATFIVLARRAGSVRWRESIGGWLFEVATRVARKAAARAVRQSAREGHLVAVPEPADPAPTDPADLTALQHVLDEELRNLPEKLRTPVVLCHLEGVSQDEVARHLGISNGQLRGRLYRAKERLRERLLRRGFTLPAVLLALTVALSAEGVPPALAAVTLRLVSTFDPIPPAVHHLAQGVIREMTTTLKAVAALVLFGALGLAAVGFAMRPAQADPPQSTPIPPRADARLATPPDRVRTTQPEPRTGDEDENKSDRDRVWCTIKSVDATKAVLWVQLLSDRYADDDKEVGNRRLFRGEKVELNAKTNLSFAGNKGIKVTDLRPDMRALLVYAPDPNFDPGAPDNLSKPLAVWAEWPHQSGRVAATNVAKSTLTFLLEGKGRVGLPITLDVAKDAPIVVDGFPGELGNVPIGANVSLELSLDQRSVIAIDTGPIADWLPGTVRTVDPVTRTLVVELDADSDNGKRTVTLSLPVKADATMWLEKKCNPGFSRVVTMLAKENSSAVIRGWQKWDDGVKLQAAKLSDLRLKMRVRLQLSADRKDVIGILAAPPLRTM